MAASLFLYCGAGLALARAVAACVRRRANVTRNRELALAAGGLLVVAIALVGPPSESRADHRRHGSTPSRPSGSSTAPVWQFNEVHSIAVAAPPGYFARK